MTLPSDLNKFLADGLLKQRKTAELKQSIRSVFDLYQESGYEIEDIAREALDLIEEKSRTDYPGYRKTWTEMLPHAESLVEICKVPRTKPESLHRFLADGLLKQIKTAELKQSIRSVFDLYQESGYDTTDILKEVQNLIREELSNKNLKYRQKLLEMLPHIQKLVEISETPGRELP